MSIVNTEENEKECKCKKCPSYPGEGILFCVKGKSVRPPREEGCICVDCSLWQKTIRHDCYFCKHGIAG